MLVSAGHYFEPFLDKAWHPEFCQLREMSTNLGAEQWSSTVAEYVGEPLWCKSLGFSLKELGNNGRCELSSLVSYKKMVIHHHMIAYKYIKQIQLQKLIIKLIIERKRNKSSMYKINLTKHQTILIFIYTYITNEKGILGTPKSILSVFGMRSWRLFLTFRSWHLRQWGHPGWDFHLRAKRLLPWLHHFFANKNAQVRDHGLEMTFEQKGLANFRFFGGKLPRAYLTSFGIGCGM